MTKDAVILELKEEISLLKKRVQERDQLLKTQEELIRYLKLLKFGSKSEQVDPNQLQLLEALQQEVSKPKPGVEPPKPKTQREPSQPRPRVEFPESLERREVIVPVSLEPCTCCGESTRVIGYEVSEALDCEPVRYFVKVTKREKAACSKCSGHGVRTAPAPARILPQSRFSDDFILEVLIRKFRYHFPLNRQSLLFKSEHNLRISRGVLSGQVRQVGGHLLGIFRYMRLEVLAEDYLQADETPLPVQSDRKKGSNHQAYLFEYGRPGGTVVYHFRMSRSREGPREFLQGFKGVLQTDGYEGYNDIPGTVRAGCLAHLRRKFVEAWKLGDKSPENQEIIQTIRELYRIERQCKGLDPVSRLEQRKLHSTPLWEQLRELIVRTRQQVLPKSQMGKACDYALRQWERIGKFLEHGQVEIDNNLCEQSMRPIALGRKNWLHIGSEEMGPRTAAILSVVESCRRLGIDLQTYLKDVLVGLSERPASDLPHLTPQAWLKARSA